MKSIATTDPIRQAIVEEALSWCGTPFHHGQRVKGRGCDCINLLIGVYHAVGLIPDVEPEHYPPDWHLHRDRERMLDEVQTYAHLVQEPQPQPGDAAFFRFGRVVSHSAIIIDDEIMVHAFVTAGRVERCERTTLDDRLVSYWSVL